MWFRRFRHNGEPGQGPGGSPFGTWHDSGLADEVVAYIDGRVVEHCAAQGRLVPSWAALNRLAHGDRDELLDVAAGANRSCAQRWAPTERFVAARLVAQATTQKRLEALQSQLLIPLELEFIEREVDKVGADEVLRAAIEALDTYAG
jgi:hypothetical protein